MAARPLHIMMLTHSYPPVLGGIERHVRTLSVALARRGHTVSVITLGDGRLPARSDDEGVQVYRLRGTVHRMERLLFSHPGRSYSPPFPDPEITLQLRAILARERPAIVHAHNWLVHAFLPLKRWSRAKLVVTLHDYDMVCAKWNLMRGDSLCEGPGVARCLSCAYHHYGAAKGLPTVTLGWGASRWEWASADMFLAVSQAVAQGNQLALRQAPFAVVPNFIDRAGLGPASDDARLASLPGEAFMLFVGALTRSKGIRVLLQAYEQLRGRMRVPPLVLIGYETADEPIDPATLPAGVVVLKNWPNELVLEAWRRCAFGIVPSVWPEPCPTVVMEAMCQGRAVVGSAIGGLPDLIDDRRTGLLVPPGDAGTLAQAMAILLSSPALCERMGQAGARKVAAFEAGHIVPVIEQVYRRALGGEVSRDEADALLRRRLGTPDE